MTYGYEKYFATSAASQTPINILRRYLMLFDTGNTGRTFAEAEATMEMALSTELLRLDFHVLEDGNSGCLLHQGAKVSDIYACTDRETVRDLAYEHLKVKHFAQYEKLKQGVLR
jgi:hypothetical protein